MQDREHGRKVSYHDVPEVFRLLGMEHLGSLVDPQILYQVGPKQPGHISSCIPIQAPIHAGMSPKSFFWLQECMMKPIIFCFERGS